MDRREFLFGLAGVAAISAASHLDGLAQVPGRKASRPNIVLMLVDDLGYGDFGCYGNQFHETPNIDRLGREGMKFTNAYAAAPVCSPSRAGILTGQSPARLHLTQWIPGTKFTEKPLIEPQFEQHLPAGIPTIASELKKLGYQTASIGKWHLGDQGYLPESFGFDLNVAGDRHGNPGLPHGYFGPFAYQGLNGYTEHDALTEVLTSKACDFLDHAASRGPFFLYLAEYAVHLPLQARAETVAKYKRKSHGSDEPDSTYAAMVESVDTALGTVIARLEALGVAEDTIIILTSDNGGVGFQGRNLHRIADNGPLRGGKGYLYEGGIREPLLVRWPGTIKGGSVSDMSVHGCDLMPTILTMAGGPPSKTDGVDLCPLLHGGEVPEPKALYWHYPHYSDQGGRPSGAIRIGEWKLIECFEDGHLELYNLRVDSAEQYDLASTYADKAQELHEQLQRWRVTMNAQMPTRRTA